MATEITDEELTALYLESLSWGVTSNGTIIWPSKHEASRP